MRHRLVIVPLLSIALAAPAFAEDAVSAAKKACENYNALSGTGDAAKLVNAFYTEKAVFIGPKPLAGILVGRAAIEKNYAEVFKTHNVSTGTCANAMALNEATVLVSGTWMATPKDPSGNAIKGTYGMTFVNDGGKWLAAMDSWNVDLPPPAKTQ